MVARAARTRPLAAQLAIYLGHIRSGVIAATIVAAAFILPSFLMVRAISVAYVQYGRLPWMQSLFYGIGAAVIGIIRSAQKLTTLTLATNRLLWTIFAVMSLATAWTQREIVWLFLAAGVVTAALAVARQRSLSTTASLAPLASPSSLFSTVS